ncbi:vesicle-associated membrane protein 5 [Clupea harengus]|uniref:Vesicle-associated membrane protein 5 n=1 Tax=Clupea harengus TaxID=7950 RepID=A0A8M1KGF0_CLUHA|nr:vesicle-associated membrane protein 5 [Clupea harengus]
MENGKNRLQQAQDDVDEVKVIMLDNLNKAEERSGKLGELENRADLLLQQSKGFAKTAVKVKRKKQWENNKMKILIAGIASGVIVVIILVAVLTNIDFSSSGSNEPEKTSTAGP